MLVSLIHNADIMNPLLAIGLIGAGLIVFNRLQTAGSAERLKYVFKNIKAEFQSAFVVQVNIDIEIQNPTSNSFVIQSMAGDLSLNGQYLGNVSNFTATQITGNSATPYRVSVQLSTLSMSANLVSLLTNFSGVTAKIDGTINVDNLGVPIMLSYKAM
jgi:LEA14-like dessication related protein